MRNDPAWTVSEILLLCEALASLVSVGFAYVAFSIGMTFQVSGTALSTRGFAAPRCGTRCSPDLFGTGLPATTINLVASLTTR